MGRARYGAGPLHFMGLAAGLAFAGYLVSILWPAPNSLRILIWLASAALLHDLVLWPLYTLLDRAARAARRAAPRHGGGGRPGVPWVNHVRVPIVLSAVMLAISFPLVLRHSEAAYHAASGLTENPYLGRWLLLTAAAFISSAALYAVRLARRGVSR